MKQLFISQPMRDKTDDEILATRERAIAEAKKKLGEDVEVIEYINFLEDRLIELCDKWERLYKKNKRLKKKVKRLSAYIDEMENVELS